MCAVKIAALEAENVKRIRAVALEPSPSGLTVLDMLHVYIIK